MGDVVEQAKANQMIALACASGSLEERATSAMMVMRWEITWRTKPPDRPPWPADILPVLTVRIARVEAEAERRRLTARAYFGHVVPPPRALPDPQAIPPWLDRPEDPDMDWWYEAQAAGLREERLQRELGRKPTYDEAVAAETYDESEDEDEGGEDAYEQFHASYVASERMDMDGPNRIKGMVCSVCDGPVWNTSGGTCCRHGHGGAPLIDVALRDALLGKGEVPPFQRPQPKPPKAAAPKPTPPPEPPKPRELDLSIVSIPLSEEQQKGLGVLLDFIDRRRPEVRLAGVAGSGKTTLMRALIELLGGRAYYLLAPTNQARKRLQEVTGVETKTIHSFIYPKPDESPTGELVFPDPMLGEDVDPSAVIIIDETSMIGQKLARDVRRIFTGTLVWVGDPEQLPPVGEPAGVDLANAEVTLREVHRQAAGSPPLALATAVRTTAYPAQYHLNQLASQHRVPFISGGASLVARKLLADHRQGKDAVVLVWSNDHRRQINNAYRVAVGATLALHPGDRIVIATNHYHLGLQNGDVLFVEAATWEPAPPWLSGAIGTALCRVQVMGRKDPLWVSDLTLCAERKVWQSAVAVARSAVDQIFAEGTDNHAQVMRSVNAIVHADYAYAMTTHRYQGSQAESVYLVWDADWTWKPRKVKSEKEARVRFDETRRWLYTSLTRTKKDLTIITLSREE